jgi:(p)ppGpp synthase/HD superfamily hydrolase
MEETMNIILEAAAFAKIAHEGQKRKYNGRDYIEHPARVAARTMIYSDDERLIAAAWMHDVVEDTSITIEEIRDQFGHTVANYVSELTNTSRAIRKPRAERKKIDRDRIVLISPNAKLVKCIDRIDNLREMDLSPIGFRRLYADESLRLADVLRSKYLHDELIDELIGLAKGYLHPTDEGCDDN